jgi:chromosome segregation ATPase
VVSVLREKCGESPRKGASPPVRRRPDSTARQMVDYTAEEFEPLSGFEGSAPSKSPKAMLQAGEDGGEKRLPGLLGGADSEAGGGRRGVDGGGGGGVDTRRSLELERRRREAAEAREAQSREELKSALRDLDKSRRALSEVCLVPFPLPSSPSPSPSLPSLLLPLHLLRSVFPSPVPLPENTSMRLSTTSSFQHLPSRLRPPNPSIAQIKTERDLEREETASLSASFSRASQEAADLAVVVEELTEEVQSVRRENNAMRRERSGGGGAGGRSESQRELEGLRAEVSRLKGALEREKDEHLDSRSTLTDLVEALKDSLSQTETMLDGSRSREGQLKLQISRLTQELDNLGETDLAGDGRRRGSALLAKKLEEAQQTLQQERAQWQVEALEYRDKLSAAQTVIAGLRSKSRTTSSNGSEAGDSEEAQNHRALVERLEADVRAANQERLEMVKMVETFKSAVAHAKMHVQGAQEEREATEQRLEQALAEGEALGKEVAELEGSLRKSQEMTVALTNDKLEQQRSLASSEKKVMSLQREVEEVKGAVEALELELGEARNGLVDRDGAVAKLEGEVESMKGCLSKAEEEREANQSRKAELLRSLSSAESTVTELRRRVDLAEARVSEAEERSKEAEEEGEKAAKHVEECERELSVASSRIQGLEADVMRLKGDLSKSVAELEASKVVQETVAIEAAEAVERQLQEYKQVVLEREGEAKELRRLRASIEEERDGLRVKVGEMEGKLADAASAVEERDAFEGKASELERELAKERESWGVREGALCSELEVSRSDISRLEKEVEVLEGRLRDAERERGDAEGKVGELSVAMDDFRRAHQEASAAWVVQEQELNRELKDAREHVGRMEEDAAEAKREREEALQGSRGEVARLEEEMKEKVMRLEKEKEEKVMRLEKEKEEAQQQAERVRIDLQGAQEEAEGLRSSLGEPQIPEISLNPWIFN